MPEGFQTVEDEQILQRALSLAAKEKSAPKTETGELAPEFVNYLDQLVRYATGEDRNWEEPAALVARAISTWKCSEKRSPGQSIISLRIDRAEDWRAARLVLDIATDDKPFLVDSITAALADAGKPVSFFVNALIDARRDKKGKRTHAEDGVAVRESLIHAEMDPPFDDSETADLEAELQRVLDDVSIAVTDWESMRARLGACIAQLERARPQGVEREDLREAVEFLKWLWDNRFAFLGVRRYAFDARGGKMKFEHDAKADLGILRDGDRRVLRSTYTPEGDLSPAVADFMSSGEPIIVAKANARSNVHRRVYMDYIGVKTYSVDGRVNGEERFVGLFTSDAYNHPASDIPLLRKKMREVIEGAGFVPGGHNEKAILNILETFPRDEMFQTDLQHLRETSLGVLRLYKRPRAKLFLRRDRFDRFVSALVFVPRDRFSSSVREAIGELLASAYQGRVSAFYPHFGDAALVRVHFIIGIDCGAPEGPGIAELTRRVRALTRTWADGLLDELRAASAGASPKPLYDRYEDAFGASYQERTTPREAIDDIAILESMGQKKLAERAFRRPADPDRVVNIKLYSRSGPLRLSDLIPKLENLGLSVVQEAGHGVKPGAGDSFWIHDFYAEEKLGRAVDVDAVRQNLEDAFEAVLSGRTEDDGFNALVIAAGLHWREAWMLRAVARYCLQAGFAFSQSYIEETLARHPNIARGLIAAFHARFNPAGPESPKAREKETDAADAAVLQQLDEVSSLDEDRIIRRYLSIFAAMTRTNYYRRAADGGEKAWISFKLDSERIPELPDPKPFREIFVSSPAVDGVHLRFGAVARGGLRWSDRREDFRTEVLGLVKAQRVKNAVIVPTGSKGGFYPKQLPAGGDRNAVYEAGREAYKIFIRGLLDLTDNIVAGKTITPAGVVRWDAPDPYLVVAADKGTAAFSDTANAIAAEYAFWLGDAFASGGSKGYDHKVMGITARGAWEAVKRHFRELGKDIQTETFTVAGVGDMSGDVFGNGMLLSTQIRLVAAFDHRDIFIDPNPDPAISFAERQRLFNLPRSSWADYNKSLISKGGGVFSRAAKSIPLSAEARALLGLSGGAAAPAEIMRAILKAPVELFWLGGIGTYFKASTEDHAYVGDRANDAIRVDAEDMQMKVIGEGANLGLTQAARIAFARRGGKLNTDAIDNSAGVDSSDHEVNIKILLSAAIESGELKADARDDLLKQMTEDVARHVLRHNYEQTRAISQMAATGASDLDDYGRVIASLEAEGKLDRAIEGLPDDRTLAALRAQGACLTRPELAVLLAYAKMWLFEQLVNSPAPDDPMLERELFGYFPDDARNFNAALVKHRLRREIIATRLANEIVDTCGAAFAHRMIDLTGASVADIALSYEAARRILELGPFAASVDALDASASAELQISLYNAASALLAEQVFSIVSNVAASEALARQGVKGLIAQYKAPIDALKAALSDVLPPLDAEALAARAQNWREAGAPETVAAEAAAMPSLEFAFDIVNLARETGWPAEKIGAVFFAAGQRLKIENARTAARRTKSATHFDRLATRQLAEELTARQYAVARSIAATAGGAPEGPPAEWLTATVDLWRTRHGPALARYEAVAEDLTLDGDMSVSRLSLLNRKLAELVERTS